MARRSLSKQSLEKQVLINKKNLEKQIEVCKLQEEYGSTKAAEILTASGRCMGRTTVRQIFVTYQVFKASEIIQELFYSGRITWARIYESRRIYDRGEIKKDALIDLEDSLLSIAGASRENLKISIQNKQSNNGEQRKQPDDYKSINDYYKQLEAEVNQARLNKLDRLKRLQTAPKTPETLEIVHRVFKRNPDVIAEVLERADGFCERCRNAAPFLRKSDRTPFLEVHHSIPLAQGGEDTVENAVALCPNCHRERHYGSPN